MNQLPQQNQPKAYMLAKLHNQTFTAMFKLYLQLMKNVLLLFNLLISLYFMHLTVALHSDEIAFLATSNVSS